MSRVYCCLYKYNRVILEMDELIKQERNINMNHKNISGIGVMFVFIIFYLTMSIIDKFNYLDFVYLLFIIGCFIRFIFIKKEQN